MTPKVGRSVFSNLCKNLIILALAMGSALTGSALATTTETVLHDFTGNPEAYPDFALVFDKSGNLYGTTEGFGGEVFKLSPNGTGGWNYSVIQDFTASGRCNQVGCYPNGQLTVDGSGNLYGTMGTGGPNGSGTIFELSPNADGSWSFKLLHIFGPEFSGDGYSPNGVVYFNGALFGTTSFGGANDYGSVFSLTANADGSWSENIIHGFAASDAWCYSGVTLDPAGNIYGTTSGTAFELTPNGDSTWTDHTRYTFPSGTGPGVYRLSIIFANGKIYGAGMSGSHGEIYELSPSGSSWIETTLYTFAGGTDGSNPTGVTMDSQGRLFGTTTNGGGVGSCKNYPNPQNLYCGTAFFLTPSSSGPWTETILHRFGGHAGSGPSAPVVVDKNDNAYGVTYNGGTIATQYGYGVVFKLNHPPITKATAGVE
jgi:uncharacterized repeat protein (TIGR03803 family)